MTESIIVLFQNRHQQFPLSTISMDSKRKTSDSKGSLEYTFGMTQSGISTIHSKNFQDYPEW